VSFDSKRDEILRNGVEAAMSGRLSDQKNPKGKTESMTAQEKQDKIDELFL